MKLQEGIVAWGRLTALGLYREAKEKKRLVTLIQLQEPGKTTRRSRQLQRKLQVDLRHPHGEKTNHTFVIERLEDVPTDERVVDSGIFVLAEIGQMVLANVHHSLVLCSACYPTVDSSAKCLNAYELGDVVSPKNEL